jgi:hypothetical protein
VVDTVAAVVAFVTAVDPIAVTMSDALAALKALVPFPFTRAPEVIEVAPVPPLATGKVPVTPVVNGSPVQLVKVPELGVPSTGVVKVGEVNVAPDRSALVAIAVAMLLNSVSISVPLTILFALPEARLSLDAKLVLFT